MEAELDSQLGALSTALRRTAHALDSHSRRQARLCGLTGPQALLIAELAGGRALSVGELARRLSLSQAATSELTQRLEARDYLRRARSALDRRRTEVLLTDAGRQALAAEAGLLPAHFRGRFAQLPPAAREQLVASLLQLAQLLNPDESLTDARTHVRNTRRDPLRL